MKINGNKLISYYTKRIIYIMPTHFIKNIYFYQLVL